jgi:hypothetical protein
MRRKSLWIAGGSELSNTVLAAERRARPGISLASKRADRHHADWPLHRTLAPYPGQNDEMK